MTPVPDAPADSFPISRYHLQEVLGEGTTSTVYRAWDDHDETDRAIKLLSPAMAAHASMRERFLREASVTARLRHTNMVQVHDAGDADGQLYIVMDLVPGGTLEQVIDLSGPIPARKATSLLQQVLHALHYAHAQGVVHRDVNPGNIMLTMDGTPKVVDFGIGRTFERDPRLTTDPGSVLGTWGYMAPEQGIDSVHVDNRTDVYAAGATLYAVLTGQRPDRLFRSDIDPTAWDEVPAPLVPVIQRATRYQPDERYQTAAEMAAALAEAHDLLPALTPEEEATIVVRPSAPHDTVVRKQLNLSNIVPPDQAKAERQRRRKEGRAQRQREEAPTAQHPVIRVKRGRKPGLRDASPAQLLAIGASVVLALAMIWIALS
jgi:serine/threonine protein kinase